MNAQELFLKDGRPSGVFFCGECRLTRRTEEEAERCCGPYKCEDCGVDVDRKRFRTVCPDCEAKRQAARERMQFDKARKIEYDGGWVYWEGIGQNYFESLEDLLEQIEDEELEKPEYVWACKSIQFARLHLSSVLEQIESCGDAYEDFDSDDLHGISVLAAAINEFNELNKDIVSYQPDYTKAIILKNV